jgi:hypothetical protein
MSLKGFKWFRWHIWPKPKDKPIESVYEIVLLIIILSGCMYCYVRMNRISVINRELDLVCLNNYRCVKIEDSGNIVVEPFQPAAWVIYEMPLSRMFQSVNNHLNIYLGGNKEELTDSTNNDLGHKIKVCFNELVDSAFRKDVYRAIEHYADSVEKEEPTIKNMPAFLIRQKEVVRDNYIFKPRDGYYSRNHIDTVNSFHINQYKIDSEYKADTLSINCIASGSNLKRDSLTYPGDVNAYDISYGINDGSGQTMGTPSWFDLEDISQIYVKFKLRTSGIDSLRLRFSFVGAVEFSNIYPEPDYITMDAIEWNDPNKIANIRYQGLQFFVHSLEYDNIQKIRLFLITSIIGAIFTLLVVFIIVGVYKTIYEVTFTDDCPTK